MRKSIYFLIVGFFCISAIRAKTITSDVAQTVAANFFKQNVGLKVKTVTKVYTATSSAGDAAYFAFNINAGDGFVIVVADDAQYPVIGYSDKGSFVVPTAASNFGFWMEKRKNEIIANKAQNIQATAEISSQWNAYINSTVVEPRVTSSVAPLVQTLWDQPSPYNALCPGGSVTGCVATAMAQILRYWSFPVKGTGSSSYNSSYGTLSADYGNTIYNWSNMPTGNVTSSNNDVATIMYQCGVSVDMEYSPSESGAWVTTYDDPSVCAQVSYSKYFGYDPGTIKGLQRFNYTDQDWITLIETDLNASRVVQYVGYDPSAGGHTWVCDGYDDNNNLHMNWGWSGSDDGYFSINSLNPGGSFNFSNGHEVLVGIEPKASVPNDAGILSVTSPNGTTCQPTITPVVQLQNFGIATLTSCIVNYYIDTDSTHTYSWHGSLITGQKVNITLPAMSTTSGTHSFTSFTTYPNESTDGNTANDQSTGSFTIASSPPLLPISEGFEGSTFLPAGWSIWNPDNDATWQIVPTVAHTGTNSIGINNCDGDGNTDMTGTKDRFITMPYDFSNKADVSLSFDVAYSPCSLNGTLYTDTLVVYYSLDCGSTWTSCYNKGGIALASAPTYNADNYGCWSPDSSQWRTDVINLSSLLGQQSVMLAFENRSGWGEWLYIDNINIAGTSITGIPSVPGVQSFSVYPNPASSMFTVEGQGSGDKVHYSLYNVIGEELKAGDIATNGSRFLQSIPVSDLSQGMYLLRVSDAVHSWTTKLDIR